jgi:hypothetical protein
LARLERGEKVKSLATDSWDALGQTKINFNHRLTPMNMNGKKSKY